MTRVASWAQRLTEDVIGGAPVEIGKKYQHPTDGPIEIVSGAYWGDNGLSNFWRWTVLSTGETHRGYADTWPEIAEHDAPTDPDAVAPSPAAETTATRQGFLRIEHGVL